MSPTLRDVAEILAALALIATPIAAFFGLRGRVNANEASLASVHEALGNVRVEVRQDTGELLREADRQLKALWKKVGAMESDSKAQALAINTVSTKLDGLESGLTQRLMGFEKRLEAGLKDTRDGIESIRVLFVDHITKAQP